MSFPSAEELKRCHRDISPFIHHTPVLTSELLNRITGAKLFFKCENFQKMGAFKMRGAMNAVLHLSEVKSKKVWLPIHREILPRLCPFLQKILGLKAWIVMPSTAPQVKKDAVIGYGAEIVECEPTLQAREKTLKEVVAKTGAVFIHPSNNMDVIAGNSTAAMELISETAARSML